MQLKEHHKYKTRDGSTVTITQCNTPTGKVEGQLVTNYGNDYALIFEPTGKLAYTPEDSHWDIVSEIQETKKILNPPPFPVKQKQTEIMPVIIAVSYVRLAVQQLEMRLHQLCGGDISLALSIANIVNENAKARFFSINHPKA